jgi:hypothetical protein
MKDAAKALGDRDLTDFDQEMEKLANKLEAEDRDKARKTLEEAAEAARKQGAKDVAKALEEQKRLLEERGKNRDKLKELSKAFGDALPDDAKKALKDFDGSGSGKDAQKLADKLEDALGKLSPEERKRIADKLRKQAEQLKDAGGGEDGAPGAMSKQDLRDLAKDLDTPEGQQRLEDALRQMAGEPGPESDESKRQRGLDDAEKGEGDAEEQLGGGMPMPMPMSGGDDGQPGGKPGGKEGGGKEDGPSQSGHTEGGGPGSHDGVTGKVDAPGVRAKADSRMNRGAPMPGVIQGRTTGRAGETANVQGTGALGTVGPEEVGGVERSEVPEEYREQVGRYFQPK